MLNEFALEDWWQASDFQFRQVEESSNSASQVSGEGYWNLSNYLFGIAFAFASFYGISNLLGEICFR